MKNEFSTDRSEETRVVAAFVLRTTLEALPGLKRSLIEQGCEIVYQRNAPSGTKLWITGRDPYEEESL